MIISRVASLILLLGSSSSLATSSPSEVSSLVTEVSIGTYYAAWGNSDTLFGAAMSAVGDVDADGTVDLAIGVPKRDSSQDGAVFLVYQTITGEWHDYAIISPETVGIPTGNRARFGMAIAQVGSVDPEGIVTMAVSSIGASALVSPFPEGAVHLIRVSYATGTVWRHATFRGSEVGMDDSSTEFGKALVAVGDVDGDGAADVLVGAPGAAGGASRPIGE